MELLPFISVKSVSFDWAEGAGVVAPIVFYRGAQLGVAVAAVGGFKIRVFAVKYFGAVARF